ncbi:MAG: sugar-binding domain-containing protein [Ginsengibacter sp.]
MKNCFSLARFFTFILFINILNADLYAQANHITSNKIDLSGKWAFQIDSLDKGVEANWFAKNLDDKINLPGSILTNGKGNDITVDTKWTGGIWDSLWYKQPAFAKYRRPGNIKVSFWLQPLKHYVGVAWYQKKIKIPANWDKRFTQMFLERCHWESTVWIDHQKVDMQNALSAPHIYDLSEYLTPGEHTITIRMDNRIKEIDPGSDAHSVTDNTQTNWNGIVGKMYLENRPAVYISDVALYPDIDKKMVRARITINNLLNREEDETLRLSAHTTNTKTHNEVKSLSKKIYLNKDTTVIDVEYAMGNAPLLWDEFNPNVYSLQASISGEAGYDIVITDFGMKNFAIKGTQFTVNGRPIFLRGTLECAIFPKTGYADTDVKSWEHIFKICKEYGLNHIRYHSWCPPEAAFDAADKLGMYLSIECSAWANVGDGKPIDQYIYDESNRIVKQFGNHPSFCMMPYGNEASGKNDVAYLTKFVQYWQAKDNRHVYTSASGFPESEASDYNSTPKPRIQWWAAGLKSPINANPPTTDYDWTKYISKTKPTVSHEIGQWCVYPDFAEIKKYTGVLKAKNFEIFRDLLDEHGMKNLAHDFLMASGKLQVLCYKADIEAALRTPGFAGFQLLSMQDFPGQGTALVGVVNPFWEDKGYVTAKEYSQFCNEVVPLSRMKKIIYENNEEFLDTIQIANFGQHNLQEAINWNIKNVNGQILWKGAFAKKEIPIGNSFIAGEIKQSLSFIKEPGRFILTVSVGKYENTWDFFVYPSVKKKISSDILITQTLDAKAKQVLGNGGKVLLTIKKGSIKDDKGGDIKIGFSSIFWNTAWTKGQPPTTLGILCDPENPALKEFPTQYHSNYQWWDAMSHSDAILLDSVAKNIKPIVRVIDDWYSAKPLGLLFECKVGKGRLLFAGIDLISDKESRPEAKQLLQSLATYMEGDQFRPSITVSMAKIESLFKPGE